MVGSQRSEEARAEREKRAWFRDQEGRVHPALLLPTVWPQGGPSASPNLRFLQTPPSGPGRLRCKPPAPRLPRSNYELLPLLLISTNGITICAAFSLFAPLSFFLTHLCPDLGLGGG